MFSTGAKVPHSCADQQEQEEVQEQDFLQQLKQEGVKHAELGSFLDKLGGAIAGKHVSTLDIKVVAGWLSSNHRAMLPNVQYWSLAQLLGPFVAVIQKLKHSTAATLLGDVQSTVPCSMVMPNKHCISERKQAD